MYIKVNNVTLYYECVGSGHPFILLHGNGEDHTIFDVLVKQLSLQYTCYLIDTRGHGKSEAIKEYHYQDMMEDIHCFITSLQLKTPYVLGFSDGGIVSLMLGYTYPHLVKKYIVCGANLYPQGLKEKELIKIYIAYIFTRNNKMKLLLKEPNITPSELMKIEAPVLVVSGSKDMIKDSHTTEIVNAIRNVKQVIKIGYTHTSYIVHKDVLKDDIFTFLK